MVAQVSTVSFQGVEVVTVKAQVQICAGVPAFAIVGLPDKSVAESRERIRGALESIGLSMPARHITVNLSPAAVQKEGTHYDLPVVLALLEIMGIIDPGTLEGYYALGELNLDASIQPVPGVMPAAMTALKEGKSLICPYDSATEATWLEGLDVVAAPGILSLLNFFKGQQVLDPPKARIIKKKESSMDFQDIKGQQTSKRVLEIAAAGGHNVLMTGPPGSGKSMMAERLSTILPPMTPEEALELSMIYSVAGLLSGGTLMSDRPFRAPHHSASLPALVGGGIRAKPGEITLAHRGVLFLDELPEFARNTLESLRQPLEAKKVVVSRANAHYTYPASFQLIAAMNPCPCGYLGDEGRQCMRAPRCGQLYLEKLSGPFLDRMDLFVDVQALPFQELAQAPKGESSQTILSRVLQAHAFQSAQGRKELNRDLPASSMQSTCPLDKEAENLLLHAAEKWHLSARSCHRIMRVARTIADLGSCITIKSAHMAEALSYRLRTAF